MSKLCFVIMPYGGEDEAVKKHYTGVFRSIIVPAGEQAGYKVKRSDIENAPGNITHDIINDLANADMVIADLTSGNANVFFELGIRHSFRKSGTVHIIDQTHHIPFDIKHYRAIQYSTELADISKSIELIVDAIMKREEAPEKSDNPVHDAISDLPMNILSIGDSALKDQIDKLQKRTDLIESENQSLRTRVYELDPTERYRSDTNELDIDKLLDEADSIRLSTGENVLLRLKDALEDGGEEQFLEKLRTVLKNPYLSSGDFLSIASMCREQQLLDHRRAVLELASKTYPEEEQIRLALIDAYDDSPNRVYQARGRILIEEYLGITHDNTGPIVKNIDKKREKGLVLLFNFYFRMKKPYWVEVVASFAKENGVESALILRNLARAYSEQGKEENANKMYLYAIEQHPDDDTTYTWYGDFLDNLGKYEDAYIYTEKGIIAEPEDGSRYINLAIQILNRGYVRDKERNLIGPTDRKSRLRHALPYFRKALELNSPRYINQITSILVRADAVEIAKKIHNGAEIDEYIISDSFDNTLSSLARKSITSG